MLRRPFLFSSVALLVGQVFGSIPGFGAVHRQRPSRATDPKKGRYLETLSWKEAEVALQEVKVVVIPVGARTKEHGLHLPLNNDWIMAEYLTRRLLDAVSVIALPTIQYGYYPAFIEYPGSVNISKDTFRDYVMDICRSICRHGPKKVYVLNTGISTHRALEPARQLLAREGIQMEYTLLSEASREAEKKVGTQSAGTHADEIETSMMLYLAPEIVRMKLAKPDIHEDKGPGGLTRDANARTGVYSPTGAWGDPTLATREKGKVVTEALVAHIIASVEKLQSADFVPVPPRKEFL
jgi:creatinine amidohydrolase